MSDSEYYSARHGRRPQTPRLSIAELRRALKVYLLGLENEGYFQEYLGHSCVDTGFRPGIIGGDPSIEILLVLGKSHLWPMAPTLDEWYEDDLFDMIEFLYANVSKPTHRYWHDWNQCGWHCTAFDREVGQEEFRAKVNLYLKAYDLGFELSSGGRVLTLLPSGMEALVAAPIQHPNHNDVLTKVDAAIARFRHHRATVEERRTAVRELADVLEFLRPDVKGVLSRQDEKDLFNIVNNFGIRHHNGHQKTQYSLDIWVDWMFYYYLATIGAVTRLIQEQAKSARSSIRTPDRRAPGLDK